AIVSGPGITTRYIYGCPVCGKRYTTKYNMERHHMKCGSRGPQSCQICGKTFITQDSDFLETSLMFGYIQPRSAQLCGPGAKSTSQNNQCNVCGKIFTIKGNLDRHRWKCLDLRQQPCPYCHRVFHRRDNLKTHLAKCGMA
ncbi:hypothetical protein Bpfe_000394, partial [Biomphalaria pfeifferi]